MEDLVYVVKSHERVDRFFEKTYSKIILEYGFELSKVFIFVSTDSDVELYSEKYKDANIVKAPKGVAAVDNFITSYFDSGQKIIYMNDDVSGIFTVDENLKKVKASSQEVKALINEAFEVMVQNSISYGGLYPVLNTMFMSGGKDIKVDFCLIMDPFSFVINDKNVKITVSDKSDFEKSIQHFAINGALLRFNRYSLQVEYYGKKGGFQGRDEKTELSTAQEMLNKYPEYINGINVKNGGKTSLRFNRLPAKKEVFYQGEKINILENKNQLNLF